MRVTALLVLGGSCLSLLFAGCQKHDMLSKRGYIQTPDENYHQGSGVASPQSSGIDAIEPTKPAAVAPKEQVKATIIKQEEKPVYQPTETISRQPVRAAIAAPEKHIVKKGDFLGKIGRQYGVGAAKLAAYNKIDINKPIHIGQTILIPPPGTVVHVDPATLKAATKPIKPASAPVAAKASATTKLSDGHYSVKSGDSVSRIAARYKVKRSELMTVNNLNENSVLKIGQKLVIPGKTSTDAPATSKTSAIAATTVTSAVDKASVPQDVISSGQGTTDDILAGIQDPVAADAPQLPVGDAQSPAVVGPATTVAPDATSNVSKPPSIEVTTDTTLAKIAAQYGISLEVLRKANSDIKEGQIIRPGRLIFLPKQ